MRVVHTLDLYELWEYLYLYHKDLKTQPITIYIATHYVFYQFVNIPEPWANSVFGLLSSLNYQSTNK